MKLKKIVRGFAYTLLSIVGLVFLAVLLFLVVMAEITLYELAQSGDPLSMLPIIFSNGIVLVIIATFILGATEDDE